MGQVLLMPVALEELHEPLINQETNKQEHNTSLMELYHVDCVMAATYLQRGSTLQHTSSAADHFTQNEVACWGMAWHVQ